MSNSNQGITFGKKIGMIEDTVIQQQSFISQILQTIQTFLLNDTNKSNKALTEQFNQIFNDFQQQQENFKLNTAKDLNLLSNVDSNSQRINEHQIKLDDINSELKTIKYLLNNLKEGALSDDDFEKYKNEIAEIENNRAENQIYPILKTVKCLKYEMKILKKNYSNILTQNNVSGTSSDYSELNHEMESIKHEIKKLKENIGLTDNSSFDKDTDNQSNIKFDDPFKIKMYSDLYKVRDDLKEEINTLQKDTAPLLKLKELKKELKRLKEHQEDIERTNSNLLERQEKIFAKLKKLVDEKINPLDMKVDKLQSSFDSLEEIGNDDQRQDILFKQEELKRKIDELTAQINLLEENKFEPKALSQARNDLQNLKKVVDVEIPENSSNTAEEDSDEVTGDNILSVIRDLKSKIKELEAESRHPLQNDNSNITNNPIYENLEPRLRTVEERLANFDSISSNMMQKEISANQEFIDKFSQEQNGIRKSIKCLKFELKKLKIINEDKTTTKERGIDLNINNNLESNTKRIDELENEVQYLKELLNSHKEDLRNANENNQISRDIKSMKNEIEMLKEKPTQETNNEIEIQNSKIDSIETNLSEIKKELDSKIPEQFNHYNEKLQSLEDSLLSCINELNNEKEQISTRNASNQDSIIWPSIQIPAEKHEVNPLIGLLKEKIHDLINEMNQAPEQTDDTKLNKMMKPSINDAQENLKKLKEELNALLIQDKYQTIQINPQIMWDNICELKDRVSILEGNVKSRDINLHPSSHEEEEEEEFGSSTHGKRRRPSNKAINSLMLEVQKLKEREDTDSLAQKVSELLGSQQKVIIEINCQSSQIQQHSASLNDQLSRIEDLESLIQQLDNDRSQKGEIENLADELNELRESLLSVQEENEKFRNQISLLEENSYAFLGPTSTSKKDPNPVVVMLEAQVTELLKQMENPSLKEEPDETGELQPSMDQAEKDLITVQKALRELLEQEQADAKYEAAKAFNLINRHTQNRISHLEGIIKKQNKTYQAVENAHNELDTIKFRLNELSNSQQQVITVVNLQNNRIDTTKQLVSRDVIPQLDDIHTQFDDHLNEHSLYLSQIPSASKDSVIKHTPNPVVEKLREQINNLLDQIEHPDVKSTYENEKNENLKPNIEQLQRDLKVLQDTLQRILTQQIYIPADETLRSFQDQIDLLQDKYTKQIHEINELKRNGASQLEDRVSELENNIRSLKKCLENSNSRLYGEQIAKSSEEIASLDNQLRALRKEFEEAFSSNRIVSRGAIQQPVMKTTPEGHFIIKKTRHLNGTTNSNVEKLKDQIDKLNEEIRKAELSEEEDVDDIDDDLHDHLGKTSSDLLRLREQLQRVLDGYEVEEVVPLSPQQMYENITDLLQRVCRLERSTGQGGVVSRDINIESEGDVLDKINQLMSSYSVCAQTLNAHASYIHQIKDTINEESDRISEVESGLEEIRNQLDGDTIESIRDELQELKNQFDEFNDDYDIIEIEGDDAEFQVDLEDGNDNEGNNHHGERGSRLKRLESRIAKLEKRMGPNAQMLDEFSTLTTRINELTVNQNLLVQNSNEQTCKIRMLSEGACLSDQQVNSVIVPTLKCIKHELKNLKENGSSNIKSRGIELELEEEERNAKIKKLEDDYDSFLKRVKEISSSQEKVVFTLNRHKEIIDQLNDKLENVTDTIENHIENGPENEINSRLENIEEICNEIQSGGFLKGTTIQPPSKSKKVNPAIQLLKDRIDELVDQMNDPKLKENDEPTNKELDPSLSKAEKEVLVLREALKNLLEEEEEESEIVVTAESLYYMIKDMKGRLTLLETKNAKDNNDYEEANNENNERIHILEEKVDVIKTRSEELIDSHYKLIQNNNLYKSQINDITNKLGEQQDDFIDLEQRLASLEDGQVNLPDQMWSQSIIVRSPRKKKPVNPVIERIKRKIDELVNEMHDPSIQDPDQDKDAEQLKPNLNKAERELLALQQYLAALLEGEEEPTEEEILTPDSLYQMVRDIQDKVSAMEENNSNSILSRSIQLGSPGKKKKTTKKKYNNPELEVLKGRIDDLVDHINDPEVEQGDRSPKSPKLKPSFDKAEYELQVLRNTLTALIEETEEETEVEEPVLLTGDTLQDFLINLRDESGQHEKSIKEMRSILHCLKYEMKKLKEQKVQSRGVTLNNNTPATEEELMAYCDRLENIAEGFDKHIVEAKKELKRYREIRAQMKKENDSIKVLQDAVRCLKHEVKLLKYNPSSSSHRRHNDNNNKFDDFGNDNNNDNDGGDGPNKRTRSAGKTSKSGSSSKGRKTSGRSAQSKPATLEERVDEIETRVNTLTSSQGSVINCYNAQNSCLLQMKDQIEDILAKQDDENIHSRDIALVGTDEDAQDSIKCLKYEMKTLKEKANALIDDFNQIKGSQLLIISNENSQTENIRQIQQRLIEIDARQDEQEQAPICSINDDQIESMKYEMDKLRENMENINSQLNEIRGSQMHVINNSNSQTSYIHQIKDALDDVFNKQDQLESQIEESKSAVKTDEKVLNDIKCLKYEIKQLKKDDNLQNEAINQILSKQDELQNQKVIQNMDDQINQIRGSQKLVIDNCNSQTAAIRKIKELLNDIISRQNQLENKAAEEEQLKIETRDVQIATLDDESMKDFKCMKYETKKLKQDMNFIDERINQVSGSQVKITNSINSQIAHIRQIHEKLNEIIQKQNEMDNIQTRDCDLSSIDLQNRIDEISSAQEAVANSLNEQRSQIDQIKEKLNETISSQSQIMENTESLLKEQNEIKCNQISNEQLLRIEKELSELQKNHLFLRSQFYDHLKDNTNLDSITKPITDSINELRENQNDQKSIINELEDKISAQEENIKELLNNNNSKFQDDIDSIKDFINQITSNQNKTVQTVNCHSTFIRNHKDEIQKLQKEIQAIQQEPRLTEDDIEFIQQDIEKLKQSEVTTYEEIEELKISHNKMIKEIDGLKMSHKKVIKEIENLRKSEEETIDELKNDLKDKVSALEEQNSQIIQDIDNVKSEIENLLSDQKQMNTNFENEIKKTKSNINSLEEFNKVQLIPHINQFEEQIAKMKEKNKRFNESIFQRLDKLKQDNKQLSEILNFSPLLGSNKNKDHKQSLKSFFQEVADVLNNHSAFLKELDKRVSDHENQSQIIQPLSPKSRQNQKSKEENQADYVSTTEFQKYTTLYNSQIEKLAKKISSSNKSTLSTSSQMNNDELSNIKKEIDSLKITEIRKDIDTLKNNLRSQSDEVDADQSENKKVDLLLARIDKLEEQFANKTAEIDSKNNEFIELKKYTNKVAKAVKIQEEKIKNILSETINNK